MNGTKFRSHSYATWVACNAFQPRQPLAAAVLACTSDRQLAALDDQLVNRYPKATR